MKTKNTSGTTRCHYLRPAFWKENMFWETNIYSEKSKEYFRGWLSRILKDEKKLTAIDKT